MTAVGPRVRETRFMPQRIYADFNKRDHGLVLTTYGTLRDLNRQQIRLREGMVLTFYMESDEAEDLEVEGTVHFRRSGPFGENYWEAVYEQSTVRYVPVSRTCEDSRSLSCFLCRSELGFHFRANGCGKDMHCPFCGCNVLAAVAPPGDEP